MDERVLEKIGFSRSEASVYLAMLRIGSCKAGRVAKETSLNRTTVYKAFESLIQKGLISFVMKENRKYFEPSDPNNILQNLDKEEVEFRQNRKEIESILPELEKLFETNKEELEAAVFKGTRGLKASFDDMLRNLGKGDQLLTFGVPTYSEIFYGYFVAFNKTLQKNGVKCKMIIDESAKKNIEAAKKYGYEIKTLPKEFTSPAEVNIYKSKVAIVLWHKTPLAIVIKGEEIAKSFRQYFNLLWRVAS